MFKSTTFEMFNECPRLGERTFENTPRGAYNCGGYALENYGWYCPYSEEALYDLKLDEAFLYAELTEREEELFVDYMLDTIEDLRIIKDISDLLENEYAIAFRIASDDFHFVKRGENGCWYEKMGSCSKIERMTKEEVFSDCWHGNYDGELYLFAKKH